MLYEKESNTPSQQPALELAVFFFALLCNREVLLFDIQCGIIRKERWDVICCENS